MIQQHEDDDFAKLQRDIRRDTERLRKIEFDSEKPGESFARLKAEITDTVMSYSAGLADLLVGLRDWSAEQVKLVAEGHDELAERLDDLEEEESRLVPEDALLLDEVVEACKFLAEEQLKLDQSADGKKSLAELVSKCEQAKALIDAARVEEDEEDEEEDEESSPANAPS